MALFGYPALVWLVVAQVAPGEATQTRDEVKPPAEVKAAFLKLLDRPRVALDVTLDSAITDDKAGLVTERLSFASEKKADGSVERVPVLVVRPAATGGKRPAVIALHGTGGSKDSMKSVLIELARTGIIPAPIDCRYHAQR